MRILVLMRGLPGSGKSTWIRENGLEPYTLSADKLRLMYSAPDLAKKYRYRVIAVDFSDVPLEECKRRNALRDEMNILDDSTIERMNSRMKQTVIPSWIQCFSHNERIVL